MQSHEPAPFCETLSQLAPKAGDGELVQVVERGQLAPKRRAASISVHAQVGGAIVQHVGQTRKDVGDVWVDGIGFGFDVQGLSGECFCFHQLSGATRFDRAFVQPDSLVDIWSSDLGEEGQPMVRRRSERAGWRAVG